MLIDVNGNLIKRETELGAPVSRDEVTLLSFPARTSSSLFGDLSWGLSDPFNLQKKNYETAISLRNKTATRRK